MPSKKFLKVFGISAVTLLGLTACGTITAKPSNNDAPLIEITDYDKAVYNNKASVVFDAIHEAGLGSSVMNEILYLYAVKEFGPFNAQVEAAGVKVALGETTLKDAYGSQDKIDNFIRAHKVYWDEGVTDPNHTITSSERARVRAKYLAIDNRIRERLYNKISSGSYNDRHIFSEAKLLKDLRKSLESVADPDTAACYTKQFTPIDYENVFDEYLHLDNFMSEDNTYIIDKIVPEIYRELLNELYVYQENYNSLGRSYARKVNIIEIKKNDNFPKAAFYLANGLVDDLHNNLPVPNDADENPVKSLFEKYSAAYLGTDPDTAATILGDDRIKGGFTLKTDGANYGIEKYYEGTEYGDLAAKYIKLFTSKAKDSANESSFTGAGAYPTYIGLDLKTKELEEKVDNVTSGWFIKNGGLNDLPSDIRNRLFNIAVANGVKESAEEKDEISRRATDWEDSSMDPNAYVCRINGHNYLKKAERVKGESAMNDILFKDDDSGSYFIIEIEEAVSTSKLMPNSRYNYEALRNATDMENIVNEVNKLVAAGESYSSLAAKKFLKAMEIAYHDDSVYDYFYSTYPELFD